MQQDRRQAPENHKDYQQQQQLHASNDLVSTHDEHAGNPNTIARWLHNYFEYSVVAQPSHTTKQLNEASAS